MKRRRALAAALLLAAALGTSCASGEEAPYSLFCWRPETMAQEEWAGFFSVLEQAQVGQVYQAFPEGSLAGEEAAAFLREAENHGVSVYALAGAPEWGLEQDAASLISVLEEAARANQALEGGRGLQGVVADVEPYLLEEWDEDRESLMQGFADGMTLAHSRAQELGLELLLCVPTFYDADCPEALERLVQHGCDGIAVMNYNRTDEYGQILEEARLAEQYGKRLIHVAELQPPGEHDLTEINTYYHLGLGVLHASWDSLAARIPYQRLSFSYHYYAPLAELLEQEGQPAG